MFSVGFDGRALASPAGGVRRYTRELFGALAALDTLRVVAVGAPPGVVLPANVLRGPDAATLPTNVGWMLTGLPGAARRAGVDVFHAPSYTAPLGGPRPLALTIHDVSYERHPEWYPYRRDFLRRAFYRWSARTADVIVTDSHFSKAEIEAAYGLPAERIEVVPLAAARIFTPGPAGDLPAGVPPRFLLHVGDLHARRNVAVVLRSLVALRARTDMRDVALVLVGPDRGTGSEMRHIADSAGVRVIFEERMSDEGLRTLYSTATALAYPSRYEGFGLPVLEAMACGCPVIAARTSSIPEVAGDAAVLLDPDDGAAWAAAIERLLDSSTERETLRTRSLARATQFSWRRTAEETARVYQRVLGERL